MQTVQHQKHNSQKALTQAKTEADVLVMDLECQLRSTNNNLDTEQSTHRSTKGKQQKELDFLQTENTKLHEKIKTVIFFILDKKNMNDCGLCKHNRNLTKLTDYFVSFSCLVKGTTMLRE